MTKSERIKHKQLIDEFESQRARGETNIIICGNSIITSYVSPGQRIIHHVIQIPLLCDLDGIFFLTNMIHRALLL